MLNGQAIDRREIKVYGISGSFSLGRDEAIAEKYRIKYFNTVASTNNTSGAGHSKDLLTQLTPMREKVDAADIKDFSSLLQRDLSDYRANFKTIGFLLLKFHFSCAKTI